MEHLLWHPDSCEDKDGNLEALSSAGQLLTMQLSGRLIRVLWIYLNLLTQILHSCAKLGMSYHVLLLP